MNGPRLAEWQARFARVILGDGEAGDALALVDADAGTAERQLAIYRRAVTANLVGALRGAFPVLVRLLGDAFFREAAGRFARATPPESGDLNRFGAGFAAFLESHEPAASMPWLADVARLEWACHEASLAAEAEPLDLAALAQVPDSSQDRLRFAIHPAVRVVRSAWPILAIWEANQPALDGTPDRDEGADIVLVWRESGVVRAALLAGREADCLDALAAGATLGEAAGRAERDLPGFLERLARHGMLGAFRT